VATARAEEGAAAGWRTIPDVIAAARRSLTRELWDFALTGTEAEITVRRNRWALDGITFRPRLLHDVRRVEVATTFLGLPLRLPVMPAPVGPVGLYCRDGGVGVARAAHAAGTVAWIATMSAPALDEVAARAPGPLVFQLYAFGDRSWTLELVRRVERAGYAAVCLTADSVANGKRERNLRNLFHPHHAMPNVPPGAGEDHKRAFTWDDAAWLRANTRLPLVLKGVMSAADAVLAVEHGFDAVCVSNHGGRELDCLPGTAEVLREVVDAVAGRAQVVVDGGFLRGGDVVKALALGARAVLIGKLMLLALGAGGEAGLARTLDLLAGEVETACRFLGVTDVARLVPDHVRSPWDGAPTGGFPVWEGLRRPPRRRRDGGRPARAQESG
jgi:isopentenyl diphosphate isomerase/L-lactate dehydrogenase-like FMN-dependent dehydrogenase